MSIIALQLRAEQMSGTSIYSSESITAVKIHIKKQGGSKLSILHAEVQFFLS